MTPDDARTRALVAKLATHPEFALSRREIIKYILTPPGERSKDVQTLLRLEQIEKVRQSLVRILNDTKKRSESATTANERAKKELLQHLGIKSLSKSEFLSVVNERRGLLKLDLLFDLTPETSVKEGVAPADGKLVIAARLSKSNAVAEIETYSAHVAASDDTVLRKQRDAAVAILQTLIDSPDLMRSFRRKILVEQGLELLDEEACPLCDIAWDIQALQAHLREKVSKAANVSLILKNLRDSLEPILLNLDEIARAAEKITRLCAALDPKIAPEAIKNYAVSCTKDRETLGKVCNDPAGIAAAFTVLAQNRWIPSQAAVDVLAAVKASVNALPDPSKEDAAKDFLTLAQERWDRCREAKADAEEAAKRASVADNVFTIYGKASTSVLEGIYETVEHDFTEYYKFINRDDEEGFNSKLTPSVGKLAFDVDFYGRGKFPPGAYHSEGHQDAMGLCLYLALMKKTLGDQFTLAVLDDVLMSVDAGHRREVCVLLKTKFPKTQFILTTHDPVWLQFMRTENLIQSSVGFGGWTVDSGPQVWQEGDVWAKIAEQIKANDTAGAAAKMRRYLEYVSTILADNFRAKVVFHANGQYDFGDLWSDIVKAWTGLLKEAKDVAVSWQQDVGMIEGLMADAKQKVSRTNIEQWMINKALHYNSWANLQSHEFAAVAGAFQALLGSMQCPNPKCAEFLRVTPYKGEKESLRCGCGKINLNLTKK